MTEQDAKVLAAELEHHRHWQVVGVSEELFYEIGLHFNLPVGERWFIWLRHKTAANQNWFVTTCYPEMIVDINHYGNELAS